MKTNKKTTVSFTESESKTIDDFLAILEELHYIPEFYEQINPLLLGLYDFFVQFEEDEETNSPPEFDEMGSNGYLTF